MDESRPRHEKRDSLTVQKVFWNTRLLNALTMLRRRHPEIGSEVEVLEAALVDAVRNIENYLCTKEN